MSNNQNEFGSALRLSRVGSGLTLRSVANKLGVSVSYVSDIERGRRAPFKGAKLEGLCVLLGADLGEFKRLASISRGGFFLDSEGVSDLGLHVGGMLMVQWNSLSEYRFERLAEILDEAYEEE